MKKQHTYLILCVLIFSIQSCKNDTMGSDTYKYPISLSEKEQEEENNPDKNASWTPEQAANHQKKLAKLSKFSKPIDKNRSQISTSYANDALIGNWINRGPKNMPGAFKFAEMLDGTDIMYGITWNQYVGEYNSTSYIYKGTVYNPTTGTGGDDFELLTANWPNRYQNLFAFEFNGSIRLVAHIESGPVYYSDNDGQDWILANGLPEANTSSAINRQDGNTIYVTDNTSVYISTDQGVNFSLLKNFGSSQDSFVYTPRYDIQGNAEEVYLIRDGDFYKLNDSNTDFDFRGSYTSSHNARALSIGGDNRTIYVTEDSNYWISTDEGLTWTEKFPHGNFFGDLSGKMSAGFFFAAHPENPIISVAGYAIPIISTDALSTVQTDHTGWGRYQNGNHLPALEYQNHIRFNYHPDFQSSHFFYNSSGDLFSARCSDGGIFVSYKEWSDFPNPGVGYDNSGYQNAHFINLNVLNTITPLVYRNAMFTGINNVDHINYGTQDQGSQNIIPGSSGDVLEFYQVIGGDGPSIDSYDGSNAWRWDRDGDKVWSPVNVYTSGGNVLSIGQINSQFNSSQTIDFTTDSDLGWIKTYIDRHSPDKNIWMLSKSLYRATWDGSTIAGHTINVDNNQVAALAQGTIDGDKLYMLQGSKVYISNDRGDTFGTAINTPFNETQGGFTRGDIGSGVVLPGDDDWILFAGPSTNDVGAILSKDGGNTWIDVTGDFPAGSDAQTGGMIATPDGSFIFAGTDVGAYVFDVVQEEWHSLAEGIGIFNTVDLDFIETTNTMRFATWGSGILDFNIESTLGVEQNAIADTFKLYPNPASDHVFIELDGAIASRTKIDIIDINGRILYSNISLLHNNPLRINTSEFTKGMYIVRFENGDKQIKTRKIVIN